MKSCKCLIIKSLITQVYLFLCRRVRSRYEPRSTALKNSIAKRETVSWFFLFSSTYVLLLHYKRCTVLAPLHFYLNHCPLPAQVLVADDALSDKRSIPLLFEAQSHTTELA